MGTLLRSGDQLRAAAQLVEAPSGTLLTSHTVQASLGDLFHLQDDIARRVVDALSLPLTGAAPHYDPRRTSQPACVRAAICARNELARTYEGMAGARDLYQRCLELDPRFAPAWARLGRCYRVIGKYIDGAPDSEDPGRGSIPARARAQSAAVARAQVLREPGSRHRRGAARASFGCSARPRGTATIRSCSPAWSTRAATAGCSSSRSPRTPRRGGSIRTSRPASSRRC